MKNLIFALLAMLSVSHAFATTGAQTGTTALGEKNSFGTTSQTAREMKTIGIIGGITWLSSIEYYRLINQLVQKKLGGVSSAKILMYSIEFGEFSQEEKLAQAGDFASLNKTMINAATRLKHGNADFVVIASNTMNSSAGLIEETVGIPVLQIADVVGKAIKAEGMNKVVLLGTAYTMEAPFYRNFLEKNFGIEVVVPNERDRTFINHVIFEELAAEKFLPESRQRFIQITEALVRQTGAQGVVLGCTEIPLLIHQSDISVKVFDTTRIHSEAAVNMALGLNN